MTHAAFARLAASTFALAAVAGFHAVPAAAQASPEEECARLSNPEDEIICLRAALAASRQAQGGNVPTQSQSQARPAPPPPAAVPVVPPPPVASAAPDRSTELGIEQVARAPDQPRMERPSDAVLSAISEFRVDRRGNLIMQLENGQIWGQVENVDLPIFLDEGERVPVEIERSGFGGYRMTFLDIDRKISVSRLR